MSKQLANPKSLLTVGLKLAKEACKIVKDSYMNKNVKHFMKGKDDPVTEADYKIQTMLIKGFKMSFPKLRIIGEQQKQYEGKVQTQYKKLQFLSLPESLFFPKEYQLSKCCFWIDPIDNTRGFIQGDIQSVTTLIGMSYQNKAQLGIIAIPFKNDKGQAYYNPSILFGCTAGKFAYQYLPKQQKYIKLQNNNKVQQQASARIVLSPFRSNTVQNRIVEAIKGQKILAGGAGYKMAMIAKKQADLMAYSLSLTQKWDTCAGQAIIKAINGHCTSQYGEELLYDAEKPKEYNKDGVICSLDEKLIKRSVQICKEYQILQKKENDI